MYKHYIRVNKDAYIEKYFSSAFEKPQEGDICINESGGRHFNLELRNADGMLCKKYVDGQIIDVEPPLAESRARLLVAIKAEASRRILELFPLWKQLNLLQESLINPTDENKQAAQACFDVINQIRDKSNALEDKVGKAKQATLTKLNVIGDDLWVD